VVVAHEPTKPPEPEAFYIRHGLTTVDNLPAVQGGIEAGLFQWKRLD
jgi:hypothetical protein